MPLWKNTQHSFAAGQLDANVMGRQDMDIYYRGATTLKNFLVKRQGCISKRRGTDLAASLDGLLGTDANGTPIAPDKMRLVPVTNGDDGRYVIISGGIGFVASRDGVLMTDGGHVRTIDPYVAVDDDGRPVVAAGNDASRGSGMPVGLVHRVSPGNYTVTRYADTLDGSGNVTSPALQKAFDAAADGDTVRLYDDILLASNVKVTPSGTWTTSEGAAATVSWTEGDDPTSYSITTGGVTYTSIETDEYGTRSTLTFERDSETVTVTQAAKTVTLDLNGHKLTFNDGPAIGVYHASVTLVVDSSRPGAKVEVIDGEYYCYAFAAVGNGYGNNVIPGGALHLAGDIEYGMSGRGGIVLSDDAQGVVVDAGTFVFRRIPEVVGYNIPRVGLLYVSGSLVVNGGRFVNEHDAGQDGAVVSLIMMSDAATDNVITINGGEFVNLSTADHSLYGNNDRSCVIYNNSGMTTINGGRFTVVQAHNIARLRGSQNLSIVRGEFSDEGIVSLAAAGSVANETQPNADGLYGVKVSGEADYRWNGNAAQAPVPYRFAVPYADADLAALCIRQSGDTLFIAHRDYPPAKIVFDRSGFAAWEEMSFDNTDYNPPVIESAVMEGQDPVETTWPDNFDVDLKAEAQAMGTVTDAAKNTSSSSSSDSSDSRVTASQTATTYQCTVENKDRENGKKTVTTLVKTVTSSTASTKTLVYTGTTYVPVYSTVTTPGSAMNRASATSVLVTRTARYVATYVKNGKESRPSAPVSVDYDMPWANSAVVKLSLSRGDNDEEPDYYNVYKDNGSGYGLIATTDVESVATGVAGQANANSLLAPDNSAPEASVLSAADFEERKGWPNGDIGRRIVPAGRDDYSANPASDVCLVSAPANAANGIELSFGATGARFGRIGLVLDGRIHDRSLDRSYVVVSSASVTCTVTYAKADGTTATATKSLGASAVKPCPGVSVAGGMASGLPVDWLALERREFAAADGSVVLGLLCGEGDCAEFLNAHRRRMVFDLADFTYASEESQASIASVLSAKFTFGSTSYPSGLTVTQGCVRAIHFYGGASASTGGNVQDDYINPDMSITPPQMTTDVHFSTADEYPGCVGVHEQRLVFASSRANPSTIWLSRVADLYNFTARESIREDDALELTLAATEFPDINHLVTGRDLVLFGDGGEWIVAPLQGNALTYKTVSAKMQSMIGSSRTLRPLQLADETLFAERDGSCLRTISYNYTSDSYQSRDLSVIAQSVFRANPIVSMAYKQHPDSIVECVLADGTVATLVYMKEQDVAAWSVQELGGGWKAREIASPRCIVNGTTEMMLLVEKNGVFQLWRVRDDISSQAAADMVVLDGMRVEAAGEPGAGEVAVSLGDGTYAVGYPIVSEFVTVRPEPQKGQTVQMEIKNATEAEIRVADATTFSVKPYGATSGWREVLLSPVRSGTSVALAAKDCKRLMTGVNGRDGRIHVRHESPWPLTILSVSTTYQVEYENGKGGMDQ